MHRATEWQHKTSQKQLELTRARTALTVSKLEETIAKWATIKDYVVIKMTFFADDQLIK